MKVGLDWRVETTGVALAIALVGLTGCAEDTIGGVPVGAGPGFQGSGATGGGSGATGGGTGATGGGTGGGTGATGGGTGATGGGTGATGGGTGGVGGTGGAGGASGCDLTGTWGLRMVTFNTADSPLAPGAQKTSQWSLLELAQDGDAVTVAADLPCGIQTTGDAMATLRRGPMMELVPPIYQDRVQTTGRTGTSIDDGQRCQVSFERLYGTLGARGGTIQPPGRVDGNPDLATFPPLTSDDAEDWDEDGQPGVTIVVTDSPIGSGTRHALQRQWNEMAGAIDRDASEFLIPITWDFDDLVILQDQMFMVPTFFESEASVRQSPHTAQFRRLDRASVEGATPSDTCQTLRNVMPHTAEPKDAF